MPAFSLPTLPLLTPRTSFALFGLDLAAALFMTGVIWTVQIVHYPLFGRVGAADWPAYHDAHLRRMTVVVLPAMVIELSTSSLLALAHPHPSHQAYCGSASGWLC